MSCLLSDALNFGPSENMTSILARIPKGRAVCSSTPTTPKALPLAIRNYATPISSSTTTPRSKSSNIPNPSAYAVFDRRAKVAQKNRAVRRDVEHSRLTDYVKDEIAANLVDRLLVSSHL